MNLYAYCGNNQVMYADPSGYKKNSGCGSTGVESDSKQPMTWNEFQEANQGKYTNPEMNEAWSTYKSENYPNGGNHYLDRPYIRNTTIEGVNEKTLFNEKGQAYDIYLEDWIQGKPDLGHVAGHEFWYERNVAESKGWSQSKFNEYMNNPDFYIWQDSKTNQMHIYEDKH